MATLLNISFGVFAFLPQGWLFMIFVILLECIILTKMLKHKWWDELIYKAVIMSNIISGLTGIVISIALNGGWWLVVWFPWVSRNEVNSAEAFKCLAVFYLCAFILTLAIELLINWLFLMKDYKNNLILKNSLLANIASYFIGSLVLYLYSFS